MDLGLTRKTAIVTGGSRGIGKAIARELAREGVDVAIGARDVATLEATAAEIAAETGRRVLSVILDTGDDASVAAMVQHVQAEFGHIDILVNAAARAGGQGPALTLETTTAEAFWEDANIKVLGYLRCAQAVAPLMKAQGWGRIVNISGLAARQAGTIIGSMRNVAVSALTKNLADELGPFGINVTVVHPGTTRTERTPAAMAGVAERAGITVEEAERRVAEGNSVRRWITSEDIAYVVTMLASPRSIAINGDAVAAGGGTPRAIYY